MVLEEDDNPQQDEEVEENPLETKEESSHSPEVEDQLMHISVNVVQCLNQATAYTLPMCMKGKRGVALMDSGSTHTVIDLRFALKTYCRVQHNAMQKVTMAEGGVILSGSHVPNTEYFINGQVLHNSLKILQLRGYDVVLGCDWIYQHNPINLDLKTRRLVIKKEGLT